MKGVWLAVAVGCAGMAWGEEPRCISGIYPHLAMYNNDGECGTGAVAVWGERLWTVTYSPHAPNGSSDKLYEITPALEQIVRPESVGGTPANRMIHRESGQLFIGPYIIDRTMNVRVLPPSKLYGRLTANMRHLTDPANKIYYATMEEGFYEVDVRSLAVRELYPDANRMADRGGTLLPGYHGKGAYTAQGRVVYANNGETGAAAQRDPTITSGVLAQWDGKDWEVVLRNQFTEVTGPGGIEGNRDPDHDPLWSIGWDYRSLILMVLDNGVWHRYRLPKGSHSYDGAHGWNTEWPRIREIGEADLLMTMHGTFWRFPKTLSASRSGGIRPRSNYIKVIGDFCRWNDRIVFGCDDSAKSEFLNKRRAKGNLQGPGQSNSNLWFVEPGELDRFGPPIGRGAVWMHDDVAAGAWSDPYLLEGYDHRDLVLFHGAPSDVRFRLAFDRVGNGQWAEGPEVTVPPGRLTVVPLSAAQGAWVRLAAVQATPKVTAAFLYANADSRPDGSAERFAGLARPGCVDRLGGLVYGRGANLRTLGVAAYRQRAGKVEKVGFYQMGADLKLEKVADLNAFSYAVGHYGIHRDGLEVDAASAVITDNGGRRWRFPKAAGWEEPPLGERLCREVCTERDMLNLCGIFYELPAENAGGFAKARAIATPDFTVHDYCSWRGMLILTGIDAAAPASEHIIRSADGAVAVWAGVVDDLWAAGKVRGVGGPWKDRDVTAGEVSDPYLMTGFDRKALTLSRQGEGEVTFTVEIDVTGMGDWQPYKRYVVGDTPVTDSLDNLRAYWLRCRTDAACRATVWLEYR
ncbi:MAG: hypothetical protein J6334_04175 [Kiritimatiellae bacterium]|nr:hypothetical protein [Kiritimatiellia bacterium]